MPDFQTDNPEGQDTLADFLKGAGTSEPEEPKEPELILGKFRTHDDLIKAYQEAERKISEQGQLKSIYEQQLARERAERERFEKMAQDLYQRQFNQQYNQAPTPEQLAEAKQKWQDKYYEDPQAAIQELLEQERQAIFDQYVKPLYTQVQQVESRRQFEAQVARLSSQHPDFAELVPEIEKVFQEKPHIASLPDSVEVAYNLVKARQAQPDALLQNQELRARILSDPQVKQEIIKQYLQEVKSGQPPAVIGNQPGESPVALPADIKTTADARKASISLFQRYLGGGA